MDFESICRCCLSKNKKLKSLYSSLAVSDKREIIPNILESCFNLKVHTSDGFPQNICETCCKFLQETLSFRGVIEKSKSILEQYVQVNDAAEAESCGNDTDNNSAGEVSDFASNSEEAESSSSESEYFNQKTSTSQDRKNKKNAGQSSSGKDSKSTLFCTECDLKFVITQDLYDHACRVHPKSQSSGRPCDFCNEKFEDFKSLLVHRKKHITPFVCEFCWQGYINSTDLHAHMHTCIKSKRGEDGSYIKPEEVPPEKVTSQCHFCGKSYPLGYIKIHMLIHNEGKYKCKFCDKTFKQPCGLNSHVVCMHKRNRIHKCTVCDAVFTTSSSKSAHIRSIHFKEKKHVCRTCGKAFFSNSSLVKHMGTHGDARIFSCDICGKIFDLKSGLNIHLKTHNIVR